MKCWSFCLEFFWRCCSNIRITEWRWVLLLLSSSPSGYKSYVVTFVEQRNQVSWAILETVMSWRGISCASQRGLLAKMLYCSGDDWENSYFLCHGSTYNFYPNHGSFTMPFLCLYKSQTIRQYKRYTTPKGWNKENIRRIPLDDRKLNQWEVLL